MDRDDLAARAVELRAWSDELNRAMHADDVTDVERADLAAQKRIVDADAFDHEQRVRALEEAEYGHDAESVVVDAAPINGGI